MARTLILAAVLSLAVVHARATGTPERVALILEASGQVVVEHGAGTRVPQLLEWLPAGSRLRSRSGGYVRLMFHDGTRYELHGEARTLLTRKRVRMGPGVRALSSLPPFPHELLAPLPAARQAATRAAAVRVRRAQLRVLAPAPGSWVLAEEPVALGFAPEADVSDYEIEVQASNGSVIYAAHTTSGSVAVPPGTLRPGESYFWTVRGSMAVGGTAQGESEFRALPETAARTRRALLAAAEETPDDDAGLALAALEGELGREAEARRLRERVLHARLESASVAQRQSPQN